MFKDKLEDILINSLKDHVKQFISVRERYSDLCEMNRSLGRPLPTQQPLEEAWDIYEKLYRQIYMDKSGRGGLDFEIIEVFNELPLVKQLEIFKDSLPEFRVGSFCKNKTGLYYLANSVVRIIYDTSGKVEALSALGFAFAFTIKERLKREGRGHFCEYFPESSLKYYYEL